MRKVKVFYKDETISGRETEWESREYYPDEAATVAKNLELMGCFDVRIEPVQKEAA